VAAFPISHQQTTRISAPDLRRDLDLTDDELAALLDIALDMKQSPRDYARALDGKYIGLLFEKASLRTRLTFELAIKQLGGDSVFTKAPSARASRSKMSPATWTAGCTPSWPAPSRRTPSRNWRAGPRCRSSTR
jgi:hypothetical protein